MGVQANRRLQVTAELASTGLGSDVGFSTWRLEHNVESEVRGKHSMEPPASDRIQTVYLAARPEQERRQ